MEQFGDQISEWGQMYGPKLLVVLAILIIGRIVVKILTGSLRKLMTKAKTDETLIKFVCNLVRVGLMTFVFIAAINALGVQTTSFIAIIGAAGLAIGLALQSSLSNFASGVMLIIFRPFTVGDFVEAGGATGSVSEVSIFHTVFKSPDNKVIIVPNGAIMAGNIINYTAMEIRRVDLVFGVSYSDDLKKVRQTLERLIGEDSRILKDPAPIIAVSELADSSVNFIVRPWTKTADYWAVVWDLTEKVKVTFDAEGISIPFPQRDVHNIQDSAA